MTLDNITLHNSTKIYIAVKDEVIFATLEHPIKELPFEVIEPMFSGNANPEERKRAEIMVNQLFYRLQEYQVSVNVRQSL